MTPLPFYKVFASVGGANDALKEVETNRKKTHIETF